MAASPYELLLLRPNDSFSDWDLFVNESPQGSIFCYSWWLKSVHPNNFEILVIVKAGKILAGIPLPISRRWLHTVVSMPPFTQAQGILFAPSKKKTYEVRLSEEMKLMDLIIKNLPYFNYFSINFHHNFHNWLPFYWAGYKQTTRYTYIIHDVSDLDRLYENMSHASRQLVKKASNRCGISIIESDEVEILLRLNKLTFLRQGIKAPPYDEVLKKIYNESVGRSSGKIFLAKDKVSNIHSALFVVYDKKSMYGIMSGEDPKLRASGSNTLIIWHALELAKQITPSFNFCGSMIKNIEFSMRSFGAVQTPYFSISKDNRHFPSWLINLAYSLEDKLTRKN